MTENSVFPGLPKIESPCFDVDVQTIPEKYRSIARSLAEDGYAIIDFPDEKILERSENIKSSLREKFDFELWQEEKWGSGEGLRLTDEWRFNEDVKAIATNDQILETLRAVYGREPFPFQSLNFPVGTQQHPHSDTFHFNSIPERWMCGIWVALEDIEFDQGPLVYYPGTHKWPVLWGEHLGLDLFEKKAPTQSAFDEHLDALIVATGKEKKTFCCKQGQALIWTANLIHGGEKQLNNQKTRWSQVTHYFFEGCTQWRTYQSSLSTGNIVSFEPANILRNSEQLLSQSILDALPEDFDAQGYLSNNIDLVRLGFSSSQATEHYVLYGKDEGRSY